MFGKLLKYDFRSMLKQFAFVWPAALVLALVNRFTVDGMESTSVVGETTAGIAMLVYVAILVAMFVLAVIFIIQRFYKGLLGDEGYLMHTLPVKPWQLIGSKLLCAVVVTVVSILVAILSILLIVPLNGADFQLFWQQLGEISRRYSPHFTLIIVELVILILVGMAQNFLYLYLAMSIGHLFNKHRVAWCVGAYIAIDALMSALLGNVLRLTVRMEDVIEGFFSGMSDWGAAHTTIWIMIAGSAVVSAVYFAITNYILSRKLNLE